MKGNVLRREMRKQEFLKYVDKHYQEMKRKWSARLKRQGLSLNEDIYNDTIMKVCDHIEEYTGDPESYWYKAFLTNTKRDAQYHYHKRDDSIDVLKYLDEFPNEDPPILLDDISDALRSLDKKDLYLLIIYYLTDTTYAELEEITGIKNVRYRIKTIIKKVRDMKKGA